MDAFGAGRPSFGRYVVYGKRIRTAGSTKSLKPAACREFVDSDGINLIPFERNRVNVPHRYNSGSIIKHSLITAFLTIAMASAQGVQGRHPVYDPISQDEIVADTAFPPRGTEVSFESDGVKLYGLVLSAQGKGLHPHGALLGVGTNMPQFEAIKMARVRPLWLAVINFASCG